MPILFAILLALAVIIALGGALSLSEATAGVGQIAFACFLAIVARIVQAKSLHNALQREVRDAGHSAAPSTSEG